MDYLPDNITDCLMQIKVESDKSRVLMGLLIQDYPLEAKPDAMTLTCDFQRIATFINIVYDLIIKSNRIVERALEIDKAGEVV